MAVLLLFPLILLAAAAVAWALGRPLLAIAMVGVLAALLVHGGWHGFRARRRRRAEPGFPYVTVDDDGGVRELTADEEQYLNTRFEPGNGARPYVKSWYEQRNALGSMRGFLRRDRVPRYIHIKGPREPGGC